MKLKLNQIRLDGNTQSRVHMDKTTIEQYAEKIMEGVKFPPLVVYNDGVYNWLADGFHRFYAYKNCKINEVEVEVKKGDLKSAIEKSWVVNNGHGLPVKNEDKRKVAKMALTDKRWSALSSREISRLTDLSHTFVEKVKKELAEGDKPKSTKATSKPAEKPTEVRQLVRSEEYEKNHEDELAELASQTEELAKELEEVKTELAVVQMDELTEAQQEVKDTIDSLRKRVKELEDEVKSLKTSRNHYQNENAELKKTVAYWKKQASKASA